MTSTSVEAADPKEKTPDKDIDPKPVIPLRQRRLPASFWQEPSIVPTTSPQEIPLQTGPTSPNQPFPTTTLHPWTMNAGTAALPAFLPQRLTVPNSFALVQHPSSMWIRNPVNYCNCAVCLNYSYVIPRFPDAYGGLRYRPALNASCCPGFNCADLNCKLCAASVNWHPERIRQSRFRSARYNALLD